MMIAGKPVAALTDRELDLAEADVANCLVRAYAAPETAPVQTDDDGNPVTDKGRYGRYFERLCVQANAIQAEKERRNV